MIGHRLLYCGLALALAACAAPQPTPGERDEAASAGRHATGRIRGVVRFAGALPAPTVEAVLENTHICGSSVTLPRIAPGADNGVPEAFVYLEKVPSGAEARPRHAVLIDQKGCEYAPRARTMTAGALLEIVNSDPILHNVHARRLTEEGPRTVFNIAQPVQGQRTTVEASLTSPGIVALSCEAGHPWMSAYLFVADHPYVAVTDAAGAFVIDDVPAGTYPITMWHDGVRLKRILRSLQRYEFEDPYKLTQTVMVSPGSETTVNFDLVVRD